MTITRSLQSIDPGIAVHGWEDAVAPHILSIRLTGMDAEMLQIRLNNEGVAVSLGSACNSKSIEPSHVLTAMRMPREQIESTLRVSLGMPTTVDEINSLLDAMARALPRAVMQ